MKQDNNTPQKKTPASYLKSDRFKHGSMSVVVTAIFLVLIVLVNILTGLLSDRFPSINMDMTVQGLNTLSEKALEAAQKAEKDTEILILTTQDNALRNVRYTQVVNIADRMNEINRKISVRFVDLDADVEFRQEYQNENLAPLDVIVRTDGMYRLLKATGDLFVAQSNEMGEADFYSLVDGALANAVAAVNADTTGMVYFATGHAESLKTADRGGLEQLLKEQLYSTQEFNIMTEDIPQDADFLVIPAPATDYTKEEVEKLRTFLADTDGKLDKLLIYIPAIGVETPNLSELLEEWGVGVQFGYVADSDESRVIGYEYSNIIVDSASQLLEENSYSYLMAPMSVPLDVKFSFNDDISVDPLWTTSDKAFIVDRDGVVIDEAPKSMQTVATLSRKQMAADASRFANVAVFGSFYAFSDSFTSSSTFGNRSFYIDFLSKLSGREANTIYSAPVVTNAMDIVASDRTMKNMGLGVFTIGIPVLILIVGMTVFLRRRHK